MNTSGLEIVRAALVALEVSLAGGLILLFGHGLFAELSRRRRAPRIERARSVLYDLIATLEDRSLDSAVIHDDRRAALHILAVLPVRDREEVLVPLARSLEPSACEPIRIIAQEIGLLDHARSACNSPWWWKRLRGARIFYGLCSPDMAMVKLLEDVHPAVRAQAAEWAARNPSPEVVAMLLGMIDDSAELSRFAVQDSLLRLGYTVVEPLAEFLEERDGPEIEPALRVARTIPHPRFLAAAIRHSASPDAVVRSHAMSLLGSIGGHEVSRILAANLDDASADVRAAAVRALGRMGHWPRAPQMAARMRDTSWDVRRAAGLALRELGSPGILMLRRMTTDGNRFAADMARHILDLPPGVGEMTA